jgi:hypothetical protein
VRAEPGASAEAGRDLRLKRIIFLSAFERKLNIGLAVLVAIAFIYALLQHVILAAYPAPYPWLYRLGEVFYELAIAYIAAYLFYIMVNVLPTQRDRHNIYHHLSPLIAQVDGIARGLMQSLYEAAGEDPNSENTLANVRATCEKLWPSKPARIGIPTSAGIEQGTVMTVIINRITQARRVNREILSFAPYLDSQMIDTVAAIEGCGFFFVMDQWLGLYNVGHSRDGRMTHVAPELSEYLKLTGRLDEYRQRNLPDHTGEASS